MPPPWPEHLTHIFQRFLTTEYASLSSRGRPITFPLNHFLGPTGTIDVSTGLTYPAKAERVRHNPKVALLFSDPTGSGLAHPPSVLVLGHAAVRDSNLQANTDRYVDDSLRKYPAAYSGIPKFLLRQSQWYFTRIWIEVTPLHITWREAGTNEVREWQAPEGTTLPESDPPPPGRQPPAWKTPPVDWRVDAATALDKLGSPVVTYVAENGFPFLARAASARATRAGFDLTLPRSHPEATGPACLTFHRHPAVFTGQRNVAFVGTVTPSEAGATFTVERQLADWSAGGGNKLGAAWQFFLARLKIGGRLKAECERRGQPVPNINL